MFGKKQEVIKFEQNSFKANADNNEILFVRVTGVVHRKNAIVEVDPFHDAIVIKGGGDMRYYKSGNYPVFDDKHEVKNWKKGLSVDVIYIAKDTRILIRWGTPNRFSYRDEASNKVISIGANGQCDLCVSNPEQFVRKVVGVKKEFNPTEFQQRFMLTISNRFESIFLRLVEEKHLTYDRFDANKDEIGTAMGKILGEQFEEEWGMSVQNFIVANFNLNAEDTKAIEADAAERRNQERQEKEEEKKQQKLKEYLAEVERLDDKQWEREKYLRQLELQDKEAYYEVLKVIGANQSAQPAKEENKCTRCGATYKPTDKFCPKCGNRVGNLPLTCPKCKKVNEAGALFCSDCGEKL